MENEKFKQSVLKDVLNVSIDYLNVVFTSDQIWDGNVARLLLLGLLFP